MELEMRVFYWMEKQKWSAVGKIDIIKKLKSQEKPYMAKIKKLYGVTDILQLDN